MKNPFRKVHLATIGLAFSQEHSLGQRPQHIVGYGQSDFGPACVTLDDVTMGDFFEAQYARK